MIVTKHFNTRYMEAIYCEGSRHEGYSVKIVGEGRTIWVDVDIVNNDVRADWNKYIFNTKDADEVSQMEFQANDLNADLCFSLATSYLEDNKKITQKPDGSWEYFKQGVYIQLQSVNKLEKAVKNLEERGVSAKIENDTVYVIVKDNELELADFEITSQAAEYEERMLDENDEDE